MSKSGSTEDAVIGCLAGLVVFAAVVVMFGAMAWSIRFAWSFFATPYGWPPMPIPVALFAAFLLWYFRPRSRKVEVKR